MNKNRQIPCPNCNHPVSSVLDGWPTKDARIKRRRRCLACHCRFTTFESVAIGSLTMPGAAKLPPLTRKDQQPYHLLAEALTETLDRKAIHLTISKQLALGKRKTERWLKQCVKNGLITRTVSPVNRCTILFSRSSPV